MKIRKGYVAILMLLLFLGASEVVYSDSSEISVTDTRVSVDLFAFQLLPDGGGYAVGEFGTIYKFSNFNEKWKEQESGSNRSLFNVSFYDADKGIAVGSSGTILKTDDGGQSWLSVSSPRKKHLFSVKHRTEDEIWIVGDWGTILYSQDGGDSWEDRTLSDDIMLYDIAFGKNKQEGYIVGEYGTILKTENGGDAWDKLSTGTEKSIFSVALDPKDRIQAVGSDALFLKELDKADNNSFETKRITEEEGRDLPSFFSIALKGSNGIILGADGLILKTRDGGESWTKQQIPIRLTMYWFIDCEMPSPDRFFIVGKNGKTLAGKMQGGGND